MNKVVSMEEAVSKINDGAVIMMGGFAGMGNPDDIIDALIEKNVRDLTLIGNDTGNMDLGVGRMVVTKQFKKAIVSHVGTNPETQRQVQEGELELELVPQGSLVERIRAGGFGLGGVLTKTGLGTLVAEGKDTVMVDGEEYLLERPLKADVAILYASKADKMGNIVYHGSTMSHQPAMATAADVTIVQADEIVEVGSFKPNDIQTQSVFVDYIVQGGK